MAVQVACWRDSVASVDTFVSAREVLELDDDQHSINDVVLAPPLAFSSPHPTSPTRHRRNASSLTSDAQSSLFGRRPSSASSLPSTPPASEPSASPKLASAPTMDVSITVTPLLPPPSGAALDKTPSQRWRRAVLADIVAQLPPSPAAWPPRQRTESPHRTLAPERLDSDDLSSAPSLAPDTPAAVAERRRGRLLALDALATPSPPPRRSSRFPSVDIEPIHLPFLLTPAFGGSWVPPPPIPHEPVASTSSLAAQASAVASEELVADDGVFVLSPRGPVTNVPGPEPRRRRLSSHPRKAARLAAARSAPATPRRSTSSMHSTPTAASDPAGSPDARAAARSEPHTPAVRELADALARHAAEEQARWQDIARRHRS